MFHYIKDPRVSYCKTFCLYFKCLLPPKNWFSSIFCCRCSQDLRGAIWPVLSLGVILTKCNFISLLLDYNLLVGVFVSKQLNYQELIEIASSAAAAGHCSANVANFFFTTALRATRILQACRNEGQLLAWNVEGTLQTFQVKNAQLRSSGGV